MTNVPKPQRQRPPEKRDRRKEARAAKVKHKK